jgi:short-subunit dehydrogenase
MSISDFETAMRIQFWGPLHLMSKIVPVMRRQSGGRIVNISSIGGRVAVPHLVLYSASKFALVGLSDGMRAELAKDNIRVTTVCPGLMRTGSIVNALIKGQHRAEYTAFALSDSLPGSSVNAERAARQIIEACRHGDARLTISAAAKIVATLDALAPGVVAAGFALANRLLPGPTDSTGDIAKTGAECEPHLAPKFLTHLSEIAAKQNNELFASGRHSSNGSVQPNETSRSEYDEYD